MKKIFFLLLVFLFNSCGYKDKSDVPPNVIFILVDDLGWKDLGYSGSEFYETPNLDKFTQNSLC